MDLQRLRWENSIKNQLFALLEIIKYQNGENSVEKSIQLFAWILNAKYRTGNLKDQVSEWRKIFPGWDLTTCLICWWGSWEVQGNHHHSSLFHQQGGFFRYFGVNHGKSFKLRFNKNICRRICRMGPAKGFKRVQKISFCNAASLFFSKNAGMICFLLIAIKLTAQVPFCYHSMVRNSHIWFVINFYISINKWFLTMKIFWS